MGSYPHGTVGFPPGMAPAPAGFAQQPSGQFAPSGEVIQAPGLVPQGLAPATSVVGGAPGPMEGVEESGESQLRDVAV